MSLLIVVGDCFATTLHTNTKQRPRVAYMNYNFLETPERVKNVE
jgi:hypothetical protein